MTLFPLLVARSIDRISFVIASRCLLSCQPSSTYTAVENSESKTAYSNAKPFREIPGPKGLPYFGTLHQYMLGPYKANAYHKALQDRYKKYGKIFKETINGETTVHIFDPDYVQVMYQNEGKNPHVVPLLETIQMYRKYRNMSPGLGNTNGEEWYRLRSAVQKVLLTPKSVTTFLPHVNQVVDNFINRMFRIRDPVTGHIANYDNEIAKWNLESCGALCFEKSLGFLETEDEDSWKQKIIDANSTIFQLSAKMRFSLPLYRIFQTPTWKKLLQTEDYFYSKGQSLVDEAFETVRQLIDNGQSLDGRFGLMNYLMKRNELTYTDISVIILSVFTDGLSTTTPSLLAQLYCLATNPEKQEKLYAEVMELSAEADAPITDEIIQRASYLKACIKEGFRFFPVGVDVSRVPLKDIVIGGYQIPAGTKVSLNNNLLLRLPEYFEDPEEYLPERWVRGGSGHNVHPYLLLPFGYGPRTCTGMRFAEQEMRVLILKLIQRFRIVWPDKKQPPSQRYVMLLRPDIQPRFQFYPRK